MPNANSVTSSNNQNTAPPSASAIQVIIWRRGDLLYRDYTYRNLTHDDIMILLRRPTSNELRLREQLANQRDPNQQDPNLINENDDSNTDNDYNNDYDSDIDSDDGFPGLIDANGMPFDD
jgi:hypothetical protein